MSSNRALNVFWTICLLLAGCITVRPVTSTPSPLPPLSVTEISTATSEESATAYVRAIVSAVTPYRIADYPSTDGKWSVGIDRFECSNSFGTGNTDSIAYEQVRLIDLSTNKEIVIADQTQNCGGLGAFGFSGLFWSPNNRYFYYNASREGQPDGGCGRYLSFPIYRLDVETQEVTYMDGGFLSPDEQKLAVWHDHEIVVWDLDRGELGRATPLRDKLPNGRMWWSQQSDSVLFLQTEFECAPNFGKSFITKLDLSNFSQSPIATFESLDARANPPPPAGTLLLASYPPLALTYNSTAWQDESLYAAGDSTINYIESKALSNCRLSVHRPTKFEFIDSKEIKRIGKYNFTVLSLDEASSDFEHLFYIADQYIAGYSLSRGAPILEVGSISSEWDECKILAEEVISTLLPLSE